MSASAAVKEEPEEENEVLGDAIDVPPGVILDKLDALLTAGRVLLRYSGGAEDWGVNGKVDGEWCAFFFEAAALCRFEDSESRWAAEVTEDWAESEQARLAELREAAARLPTSSAPQPAASRPRACRRAVFEHHRARHGAARKAKPPGVAKQPAAPPKASAPAPRAEAAVAAEPALDEEGAHDGFDEATPEAVADTGGDAPVSKVEFELRRKMESIVRDTKARLRPLKQRSRYMRFLNALRDGSDAQAIAALVGFPDLQQRYRSAGPAPAAAPPRQVAAGARHVPPPARKAAPPLDEPADEPAGEPEAAPAAPAEEAKRDDDEEVPAVDAESKVLAPLREISQDATVQFVRLVMKGRGVSATKRLKMLAYTRSQRTEEGSFRQVFIMRGPPGIGAGSWAAEQLRMQTGYADEEEDIAKSTHICAVDDFLPQVAASSDDGAPAAAAVEEAHAQNEARLELAMQLGLHPLYVEGLHLRLWEMAPYASRAQRRGYEVVFVQPTEVCAAWRDVDVLLAGCASRPGVRRAALQALLERFEPLEAADGSSAAEAMAEVLSAQRSGARPFLHIEEADAAPPEVAPAAGGKRPQAPAEAEPPAKVARVAKAAPAVAQEEEAAEEEEEDFTIPGLEEGPKFGEESKTAAALLKSFVLKSRPV